MPAAASRTELVDGVHVRIDKKTKLVVVGTGLVADHVFGRPCPTEDTNEPFEWWVWEKRLRGVNDEGKPFYSLEWIPKLGTKQQFWAEFLPALTQNFSHQPTARIRLCICGVGGPSPDLRG